MDGMITEKTVKNRIGRRKKEIHKGDCGRILIAAGSWGMAGAAILAARAALRAGAGLVRLAIPEELFPIVQVGVPEATCIRRSLSNLDLTACDAVCAGPGLGEGKESIALITKLLESCEKTLVIDADGLNIIAHQDLFGLLQRRQARFPMRTILTPHMGEAGRLLGADFPPRTDLHSSEVRLGIAQALTEKTGAIVVLKGAGTLVAAPGMQAYTNTTGNPGMATGGSGDVLSGIITGLAGQKLQDTGTESPAAADGEADICAKSLNDDGRMSAWDAALCGVYIHGLAGDLAAQELGEYGVTAGDLALYTAYALKQLCGG